MPRVDTRFVQLLAIHIIAGLGTSAFTPMVPTVTPAGAFIFPNPVSRHWYDPPFTDGFAYTLQGGGSFTEVGAPPAAFGFGPLHVVVGGAILDTLDPDEHFVFGPGVITFSLQGISPLVDTANPLAFPTFLDCTGTPTGLTMEPITTPAAIPEPGTWLLLATGCADLLAFGWRRQQRAA